MEAGKFNILIEQKATFIQDFTLYSSYDVKTKQGVPIDLTGANIVSKIKVKETDENSVLDFTGTVIDAANGKFRISLTPAQTGQISWSSGVFDVLITLSTGETFKYITGKVNVSKTVS